MLSITQNTIQTRSGIRHWISDILFIFILIGAFYAVWLGSHPLFTPDEGRYSEVAREMVISGDYITPRLNGVVFLDKPLLYYWLQASAIQLFGLSEWSLRFWPMMFGLFGCVFAYIAGHALANRRVGFLAAILLATSPIYYGGAHYANLDLEVAVLVSASLFSFIIGLQNQTQWRTWIFIAAYIFAALAALTKGLIGIVFPAIIVGSWILILNRWAVLKRMHLILGIIIFSAIVVPIYLLIQKANPNFFHFFFVTQQFSRFLSQGQYNNQANFLFYVPIIFAGFFPWTAFILQALTYHLKNIIQNKQAHASELFLLLWTMLIFLFFSIPQSKTVGYILPVFPAISVLTALYLDKIFEKSWSPGFRLGVYFMMLYNIFIIAASLIVPHLKSIELDVNLIPYLNIAAVIAFISLLSCIYYLWKKSVAGFFKIAVVTSCAFLLTLISSTGVINQKSVKSLALQIQSQMTPNDEIVSYFRYYQDLPIYLQKRITIVADWKASDILESDNWVRELWFGMSSQDTSKWLINEASFWKKWKSEKRLFVLLNTTYWNQFRKNSHYQFFKLGQYNDIILVTNKLS